MKTPLFFIAAIVAFLVFPVDFTFAASALFAGGLVAILFSDYRGTRRRYSFTPRRARTLAKVGAGSAEPLRLAA